MRTGRTQTRRQQAQRLSLVEVTSLGLRSVVKTGPRSASVGRLLRAAAVVACAALVCTVALHLAAEAGSYHAHTHAHPHGERPAGERLIAAHVGWAADRGDHGHAGHGHASHAAHRAHAARHGHVAHVHHVHRLQPRTLSEVPIRDAAWQRTLVGASRVDGAGVDGRVDGGPVWLADARSASGHSASGHSASGHSASGHSASRHSKNSHAADDASRAAHDGCGLVDHHHHCPVDGGPPAIFAASRQLAAPRVVHATQVAWHPPAMHAQILLGGAGSGASSRRQAARSPPNRRFAERSERLRI